ncbi:MAG: FAD-dependent oxidoreductase [Clostridia bacterium]|nr:FAD-dependent oxidoreductase [Clostridia bacterium]
MKAQLAIIGGGPAGLAAAIAAHEAGVRDILILERDRECGGILNQCIHNGFGLHYFGEELTGPEYAGRFIDMLKDTSVRVLSDTMALDLTPERVIHTVNTAEGYMQIEAGAVILAMGCRERTRGAISIPGTRAAGIFTAGAAQRYVNIEGYMVGKRVVVLGSGDIGLIMSRRLTLEGAEVLACVELMPYSSGLTRNIVQCLEDFGIPLYLSHTVTDIRGKNRVEGVTVSRVDENRRPIPGTEMIFDCDTLLLSVGLIPENELSKQAGIILDPRTNGPEVYENMECSIPGIFACGNVVQVHDLVDFVSEEAQLAGRSAAEFLQKGSKPAGRLITLTGGSDVSYTLPQKIRFDAMPDRIKLSFRVRRSFGESKIILRAGDAILASFKRSHMAPGEMERVTLPKKLLNEVSGNEIILEVKEA